MSNQLDTENHKCMYPYGQCKRVKTISVIPNGFNIVLDKDVSHVLQCSGFDITKHKWSDEDITCATPNSNNLALGVVDVDSIYIEESDAIAIAKHFKLLPNLEKGTIIIDTGDILRVTDGEGLSVNVNWHEDL